MEKDHALIETLEARLDAQRRLLARLVAALEPSSREPLIDWLSQRETMRDGQEDPGAVPVEENGPGIAMAEEFLMIRRLVGDRLHEMRD
ncbi:MAG: hypothetical protein ACU0DH_11140 [Paracoccus sp. (in: a-proteobacteria)]|uniref:hypothetical protein n=1 Tax=Paracoccus sp. TaxID=267 RepID=UPI002E8AD257|nr:hypothetical protein [Pseudomonadota bacterium]